MRLLMKYILVFASLYILTIAKAYAAFVPIDFSAFHNSRIQSRVSVVPEGNGVVLGGVAFNIPVGGNNEWRSITQGAGLNIIDIPVNVFRATAVNTLMNTDWGSRSGSTSFTIDFIGSDTGFFSVTLVSNDDTRDWNLFFANSINGTTAVEVAREVPGQDGNPDVMDKQFINLPADFLDETLTTMRITDNCVSGLSCAILSGLTVSTVPIPAAVWLFGSGIVGLIGIAKRSTLSP